MCVPIYLAGGHRAAHRMPASCFMSCRCRRRERARLKQVVETTSLRNFRTEEGIRKELLTDATNSSTNWSWRPPRSTTSGCPTHARRSAAARIFESRLPSSCASSRDRATARALRGEATMHSPRALACARRQGLLGRLGAGEGGVALGGAVHELVDEADGRHHKQPVVSDGAVLGEQRCKSPRHLRRHTSASRASSPSAAASRNERPLTVTTASAMAAHASSRERSRSVSMAHAIRSASSASRASSASTRLSLAASGGRAASRARAAAPSPSVRPSARRGRGGRPASAPAERPVAALPALRAGPNAPLASLVVWLVAPLPDHSIRSNPG